MKHIIVHSRADATNVALLEDGRLAEFYMERPNHRQLVGNLYKGRVVNILPGMQAAFVDIGLERNAFLYVDDLLPAHLEKQPKVKPGIADLVKPGQEVVVQLMKEPLGTKGARVTTHFTVPGRWLVYMPDADYVGVSRKIESESERQRLKVIGERIRRPGEGVILRTVAEEEAAEALEADLAYLRDLWDKVMVKAARTEAPELLYRDLDLVPRLVRDVFTNLVDELIIDDKAAYEQALSFVREMIPELSGRVRLYQDGKSILEAYGIKVQLDRALQRKIGLPSGGTIVVDHTEALTVVDVNTGKYIGSENLAETVLQTNWEAAEEIAHLLRLRDIGGIIVIDFIDMDSDEHKRRIADKLETELRKDRTKAIVVGWTGLGLMELTRKKVREQIDHQFYESCRTCGGTGRVLMKAKM